MVTVVVDGDDDVDVGGDGDGGDGVERTGLSSGEGERPLDEEVEDGEGRHEEAAEREEGVLGGEPLLGLLLLLGFGGPALQAGRETLRVALAEHLLCVCAIVARGSFHGTQQHTNHTPMS